MADDDGEHYLTAFLQTFFSTHGLDYEAYGPYVTGTITTDLTTREEVDEQLNDLIELLQASSETHEDDDDAWNVEFRNGVLDLHSQKQQLILSAVENNNDSNNGGTAVVDLVKMAEEIAISETSKQKSNNNSEEADLAKKMLLERYAFEESDDDEAGHVEGDGADEGGGPIDNRAVAKQMTLEKNQKLRNQFQESKKMSKEASARGKIEKSLAKEERRKRANKGERKR
uniref:Coiled-coil domain-containing protein 43 n=1 Tax=Leptocylindrus danicus TaxID=163516 RepID=A0A7S2KZ20_9STRA